MAVNRHQVMSGKSLHRASELDRIRPKAAEDLASHPLRRDSCTNDVQTEEIGQYLFRRPVL